MSADDGRQPGPSSQCRLGGTGQSTDRARRVINTVRQSTTVQHQLKVIKKGIERLMEENADLRDIKALLTSSLTDLDDEIQKMLFMKNIAEEAVQFQQGQGHVSSASELQESASDLRLFLPTDVYTQILDNNPIDWSSIGDSFMDNAIFSFEEDIENSGNAIDLNDEAGNLVHSGSMPSSIIHNESGGSSMTFEEEN